MNILFNRLETFFKYAAELVGCDGKVPTVTLNTFKKGRGATVLGLCYKFSNDYGIVPDSLPLYDIGNAEMTDDPQEFLISHGCSCSFSTAITYMVPTDLHNNIVSIYYFYQYNEIDLYNFVVFDLLVYDTKGDKLSGDQIWGPNRKKVALPPIVIGSCNGNQMLGEIGINGIQNRIKNLFGTKAVSKVNASIKALTVTSDNPHRAIGSMLELGDNIKNEVMRITSYQPCDMQKKSYGLGKTQHYLCDIEHFLKDLKDASPYFCYMIAQLHREWDVGSTSLTSMAVALVHQAFDWLLKKHPNTVLKITYLSELPNNIDRGCLETEVYTDVVGPYVLMPQLNSSCMLQAVRLAVATILLQQCGFGVEEVFDNRIESLVTT